MTDWFDLAKDITQDFKLEKTPEEKYEWLVFCIADDIKEALELVPLEILLHDLERKGVYLDYPKE